MTLPQERTRSVVQTRDFLTDLINPKKTPKVPKYIRLSAKRLLRHFPWDYHLEQISKKNPDVFGDINDIFTFSINNSSRLSDNKKYKKKSKNNKNI